MHISKARRCIISTSQSIWILLSLTVPAFHLTKLRKDKQCTIIRKKLFPGIDRQPLSIVEFRATESRGCNAKVPPRPVKWNYFYRRGRRRFDSRSFMRVAEPGWSGVARRGTARSAKDRFDRVFRHYAVQLLHSPLPPRASIISHQRDWRVISLTVLRPPLRRVRSGRWSR